MEEILGTAVPVTGAPTMRDDWFRAPGCLLILSVGLGRGPFSCPGHLIWQHVGLPAIGVLVGVTDGVRAWV